MWLATIASNALGLSGATYLYKIDLGNSFKRIRVKRQTDQFLRFKDHGTDYIILKTVAPKIDGKGNKHFFMYETDVHTFDMKTGKVLNEELETEFKKRILKNELEDFKDLMKEAQSDALKKRAEELYSGMDLTEEVKRSQVEAQEDDSDDVFQIDITVPSIKIGKTRQSEIEDLTPHDTISEVLSMILDGTILQSLIKPRKWSKWSVCGIMIVGMCLAYMSVIFYAVGFPEQWAQLVGLPYP